MNHLPEHHRLGSGQRRITAETQLTGAGAAIHALFPEWTQESGNWDSAWHEIRFVEGVPDRIKRRVGEELNTPYVDHDEGFVLDLADEIRVYADSQRGLLYGASALVRASRETGIPKGLMYDYPTSKLRAARVHLPSADQVPWFKSFVDLLLYFRYNTIVIEVGGGMEYKKHPEINQGWVSYCAELRSQPLGITEFKSNFPWFKNSIHTEVGGGSFLSQEVVGDLVAYCRERLLDVIPEVPSLSHSDYLLVNHTELAERADDPYPDTYCPSHQGTYQLLFDVLDEVREVFQPNTVNIGHDEWYSVALCERCRGQNPAELYAGDIERIRGYLRDHGIKTMMWADKLLDAVDTFDYPCGGAEVPVREGKVADGKILSVIPPTHSAIDLISPDIALLHWYWILDRNHETQFQKRGLHYSFGNFYACMFPEWTARCHLADGVVVSHWSFVQEEYMQRSRAFIANLLLTAHMAWSTEYKDENFDALLSACFDQLYSYKYRSVTANTSTTTGTTYVEVLHTTNRFIPYEVFNDSSRIDVAAYTIGAYVLRYDDGTEWRSPIIYGQNISHHNKTWVRELDGSGNYYNPDWSLLEVSWSTFPQRVGEMTYYRHLIANPFPEKHVVSVQAELPKGAEYTVTVRETSVH